MLCLGSLARDYGMDNLISESGWAFFFFFKYLVFTFISTD